VRVTTKATTAAPTGPALAKTMTISMGANAVEHFTLQNSGKVQFDVTYGSAKGADKECTKRVSGITLSGEGYDNTLASTSAGGYSRKTITLKAGTYTLGTDGCKGWTVILQNP
jgi:hypothetical protein